MKPGHVAVVAILSGCAGSCTTEETGASAPSSGSAGGASSVGSSTTGGAAAGGAGLGEDWPDANIWEPLNGPHSSCQFERVRESFLVRLPARASRECGEGCASLDVNRPGLPGFTLQQHVVGTTLPNGQAVAAVSTLWEDYWIREVFDVSSGDAIHVFRHLKVCGAGSPPDDPGMVIYWKENEFGGVLWLGEALAATPRWFVWDDWLQLLNTAHVDGASFTAGITGLQLPFVRVDPGSAAQQLQAPATYARDGVARGATFAWNEWSGGRGSLRTWNVDGGLQGAFTPPEPFDLTRLGIGPDRLAWIEAEGTDTLAGPWTSAHMAWAPLSTDPATSRVVSTVGLPLGQLTTGSLKVFGNHAATALECPPFDGPTCGFVLRLQQDEGYLVPRPKDWNVGEVVAVNDEHLVFRGWQTLPTSIERILVYELESLPQFGAVVP